MDKHSTNTKPLQFPKNNPAETRENLTNLWLSLSEVERKRQFVNTSAAAILTGISQRTIQRWIIEGRVQAIAVGSTYRVQITSLQHYLKHDEDSING